MISYLELENFKSFSNIKLDLRKSHGEPKKTVFIYGENGSGKSNIMLSFIFLRKSLNTLMNQESLRRTLHLRNEMVDAIKDEKAQKEFANAFFRSQFYTLADIIDDCAMIGVKKPMLLKFGFRLNGTDGSYLMEFMDGKIIREELRYQINEREGTVFSITEAGATLSPTIFFDSGFAKELHLEIEKYWGKHTFMSIILSETQSKNTKYVKAKVNENIFRVIEWMMGYSVCCKHSAGQTAHISIPYKFMRQLERGTVKRSDDKQLKSFESALNLFFTQLYTDIKSAYYEFTPEGDEFSYELHFKKLIDGNLLSIPISLESTGTQKLLEIFPMLFSGATGETVFIDEIDSGIHDLLMQNIIEQLEESFEGQLIATTHNTLLMEGLKPENIYVIRLDANGEKSTDCISSYKERTQKNHNMRNKYLQGDYEGIPYVGYIDFQELVEFVEEKHRPMDDGRGGVSL